MDNKPTRRLNSEAAAQYRGEDRVPVRPMIEVIYASGTSLSTPRKRPHRKDAAPQSLNIMFQMFAVEGEGSRQTVP